MAHGHEPHGYPTRYVKWRMRPPSNGGDPRHTPGPSSRRLRHWLIPIAGLALAFGSCTFVARALAPDDPPLDATVESDVTLPSGGNLWEAAATRPVDITEELVSQGPGTSGRPGEVPAGFDITFRLVSSRDGIALVDVDWEIRLEGSSGVPRRDLSDPSPCDVIPGRLPVNAEVEPGGEVSGRYCIMVPVDELESMDVVVVSSTGHSVKISP